MSNTRLSARRSRFMTSTASVLVGAVVGLAPVSVLADEAEEGGGLAEVAIAQAQVAQAQTGPQAQQAGEREELEQIVVTGSRIARSGFEASTPVTVVDSVDVKLSGTVNAENLLNSLPQFIPAGTSRSNNPGGGTATLSLRGLGATRNLVLVNGKRFIFFDANQVTDINTIPTALIERTEVVTGGSSAVYGSDAIAGVVNFILRDDFEGVELQTQANFDSRDASLTSDNTVTMGGNFADGRGNAVVSVNYFKRDPILQDARKFSEFAFVDGEDEDGNPAPVPGGSGSVPNGRFTGLPNGFGTATNPLGGGLDVVGREALAAALDAAGLGNLGGFGFLPDASGMNARAARNPDDLFNYAPDNFLQVPQERWAITANSHFDVHEKVTAYVESTFSNNRVDQELAPTPITGNFLFDVDNPFLSPALQEVLRQQDLAEGRVFGRVDDDDGIVSNPGSICATVRGVDANGNPVTPDVCDPNTAPVTSTVFAGTATQSTTPGDGLVLLGIGRRLEEVGPRQNKDERNAWRVALGLRGDLGSVSDDFLRNLSYDVYYSFARTRNTQLQEGNVSRSAFLEGVQKGSGGANGAPIVNPFGPNISEAGADFIRIATTNVDTSELQVASGVISGEAFDMPGLLGTSAGPVGFSFGGEWRSTSGDFRPDTALSSGDVAGFNGGDPTNGEVDVFEFFGEVRVPLLADLPFIENLTANGAFRYSNYDLDGVDSVWTYNGGLDWRVTQDLAFRGQFARSIRAPNIQELFGGQAQGFPGAIDPCSDRGTDRSAALRQACIDNGVPASAVFTRAVQPNSQIEGLFGGNPDLGPEQSDTYTFGAVFTPRWVPGLNISLDYFDIKVADVVATAFGGVNNILSFCLLQNDPQACALIDRSPVDGSIQNPFFVRSLDANAAKFKVEGIDLQVDYSWDMNFGLFSDVSSFDYNFTGTWTDKSTFTPVAQLPDQKNFCVGAFGNTCGEPTPEFKWTQRLTWNTGPVSFSVRHRFVDAVKDDLVLVPNRLGGSVDPATIVNPRFKPQHYIDLSFTYDVMENLGLFGGVNNVTDNQPPLTGDSQEQANTFPSTFDALGPEIFLGATVRF